MTVYGGKGPGGKDVGLSAPRGMHQDSQDPTANTITNSVVIVSYSSSHTDGKGNQKRSGGGPSRSPSTEATAVLGWTQSSGAIKERELERRKPVHAAHCHAQEANVQDKVMTGTVTQT